MRIQELADALYNEMEVKLADIKNDNSDTPQGLRDKSLIIASFLARLKLYISTYQFYDRAEEIIFFKNIKPSFLSKLIYYQKLFEIRSLLPLGSRGEKQLYFEKEQHKINEYLNKNNEFLIYYRSKSNALDELYFLRKEPNSWLVLNFEEYETDLTFTTVYDHKVSRIMAFELISNYIEESIDRLNGNKDTGMNEDLLNKQKVVWTGSKVSLIELLYALQSTGSCNNGTLEVKQLATYLEGWFNIDLGNYYRVFQEIRIRKISRTTFLDQLKERLIQRMDETDLNPKFK